MNTKKTNTKKTTAKKAAPKAKATAKKPAAKKPVNAKQSKGLQAANARTARPAIRRPDPNLPPSSELINDMTRNLLTLMEHLDNYAANLHALDRQRHNGVGLKRLGFKEAAFRISSKFPQYFPHWLTTAKFQAANTK